MSSCTGALLLLILTGLVMASAAHRNYVSDNMRYAHNYVAHRLNLTKPHIGNDPLFTFIKNNASCLRQHNLSLFNKTLDIYLRMFSIILDDTTTSPLLKPLSGKVQEAVKSNLTELHRKVLELKDLLQGQNPRHHRPGHRSKRENLLSKLDNIQVDDVLNQKKALAELKVFYQAASVCHYRGYVPAADSAHIAAAK
uniref:Uncharacterized protein n=1 Tax=Oryzias sinensis TaxID=183150 RepID=A0A8C7Y8K1_9TELE